MAAAAQWVWAFFFSGTVSFLIYGRKSQTYVCGRMIPVTCYNLLSLLQRYSEFSHLVQRNIYIIVVHPEPGHLLVTLLQSNIYITVVQFAWSSVLQASFSFTEVQQV